MNESISLRIVVCCVVVSEEFICCNVSRDGDDQGQAGAANQSPALGDDSQSAFSI